MEEKHAQYVSGAAQGDSFLWFLTITGEPGMYPFLHTSHNGVVYTILIIKCISNVAVQHVSEPTKSAEHVPPYNTKVSYKYHFQNLLIN